MSEQDQTAHTQTDFRGRPGWAMDGAQAGLCAPAWIAVVLFEIAKHGCWGSVGGLQRSIGRRSSLLGDWGLRALSGWSSATSSGRNGNPKQSLAARLLVPCRG
jgi:hypothetical protein